MAFKIPGEIRQSLHREIAVKREPASQLAGGLYMAYPAFPKSLGLPEDTFPRGPLY